MNNEQRIPMRELFFLIAGEAATALAIMGVYAILNKFNYTVATGAVLGGLVIVLNFIFLSVSVNRAIDAALAEMGNAGLTAEAIDAATESEDEEAEDSDESDEEETNGDNAVSAAVDANGKRLSNAIKLSYLVRTATMIAALVLALVSKQFDVIATVIPLFMQRPLLTLSALTNKNKEG